MERKHAYFAVFYSTDYTIHMWPGRSEEECREILNNLLLNENNLKICRGTNIIKRDITFVEDGFIFGHRSKNNLMNKKEK